MYSISYQITKHLVFLITAWNQLVVVFLRKQLMEMTNCSWLIGLDSGNYTEFKPFGTQKVYLYSE